MGSRHKIILALSLFLWEVNSDSQPQFDQHHICEQNQVVYLTIFGSKFLQEMSVYYNVTVFTETSETLPEATHRYRYPDFVFAIKCDTHVFRTEYKSEPLKLIIGTAQSAILEVGRIPFKRSWWMNTVKCFLSLESNNNVSLINERYGHGKKVELHLKDYTETVYAENEDELRIMIQTDKPVYKPKDIVKFRVVVVNKKLKVLPNSNITVEITDSKKNIIKRWENVQVKNGLFSSNLTLSDEPNLGNWKLSVFSGKTTNWVNFQIKKYTLPKFRVDLKHNSYVNYEKSHVTVEIRAFYTYGKGVNGNATVELKQQSTSEMYNWQSFSVREIPKEIIKYIEISNGIGQVEFDLKEMNITADDDLEKFLFTANVTESVTKDTRFAESAIELYRDNYKFKLLSPSVYKNGLPITFICKITTQDDKPVSDPNPNAVTVTSFGGIFPQLNFSLPQDGVIAANYEYERNQCPSLRLIVTYNNESKSFSFRSGYNTFSGVQLKIVSKNKQVEMGEMIEIQLRTNSAMRNIQFNYFFRNGNRFVHQGTASLDNTNATISLNLQIPKFEETERKLLLSVFFLEQHFEGRELIYDSINFVLTQNIANNIPKFQISRRTYEPGEEIEINFITNSTESVLAVRAIDESILLLPYKDNDITANTFNENSRSRFDPQSWTTLAFLTYKFEVETPRLTNFHGQDSSFPVPCPSPGNSNDFIHDESSISLNGGFRCSHDGCYGYENPVDEEHYFTKDYYSLPPVKQISKWKPRPIEIQNSGSSHLFCDSPHASGRSRSQVSISTTRPLPIPIPSEPKVRKYFPETWIWEDTVTNPNSSTTTFKTKLPDTMTSWVITYFSLNSETGLSISRTPEIITAFQPFFLSLNLPYSVPRRKAFSLQVLVHNYLSKYIMANITMDNSKNEYQFVDSREVHVSKPSKLLGIPANQVASINFVIIPTKFGVISLDVQATAIFDSKSFSDAVSRPLRVTQDGIKISNTKNVLVDLRSKDADVHNIPISFPSKRVRGADQIKLNIVGDVMGLSAENLEKLIELPTGCGEQNMLKFVPNIVILRYMKATGILTPKIQAKLLKHLEIGYMQQLKYKHPDGSYSIWGHKNRRTVGSTWLTAFVLKSFVWARKFITVDEDILKKGLTFLTSTQNQTTGEFIENGRVFETAMQGGSGSRGIPLTAYVSLALLEIAKSNLMNFDKSNLTLAADKGLYYISRRSTVQSNETYSTVLTAYALQKSNHPSKDAFYDSMNKLYENTPGYIYWEPKSQKKTNEIVSPLSVEITAYGLLTYLKRNEVEEGFPIFQWLLSQRNSNGGFKSTQDTVIGLLSLAMYATKAFSPQGNNLTVAVDMERFSEVFQVNPDHLELQKVILPYSNTTHCKITGSGNGTALVQVTSSYYINSDQDEDHSNDEPQNFPFNITTKVGKLDESGDSVELSVSTKATYTKKTGMAVVEVRLPPSYVIYDEDLKTVKESKNVKLVEMETGDGISVLNIYYDFIRDTPRSFNATLSRAYAIANVSMLSITVYEYNGDKKSVIWAKLPHKTICDVCVESNACDIEKCTG